MPESAPTFASSAVPLSRNPLGIIALFIVLVYGFASLVITFGGDSLHSEGERLPIVWFLVLFPVAVLAVFGWLVSRHHGKLYGPSDYKEETNFVKTFGPGVKPPADLGDREARIATTDSHGGAVSEEALASLDAEYEQTLEFGYCVLHTAEVLIERTPGRRGVYRVRVWIEPIENAPLSAISSVTYRVWNDFKPQTSVQTTARDNDFDLWINCYGEFPVLARVETKDGRSRTLQRYVDLPGRPPE